MKFLSCVRLFAISWTVGYQALLSVEFSRQEYWNGLPFPSPRDLPDPGVKPRCPTLQADTLLSEPPGKPLLYCTLWQVSIKICNDLFSLAIYQILIHFHYGRKILDISCCFDLVTICSNIPVFFFNSIFKNLNPVSDCV